MRRHEKDSESGVIRVSAIMLRRFCLAQHGWRAKRTFDDVATLHEIPCLRGGIRQGTRDRRSRRAMSGSFQPTA